MAFEALNLEWGIGGRLGCGMDIMVCTCGTCYVGGWAFMSSLFDCSPIPVYYDGFFSAWYIKCEIRLHISLLNQ